MAKKRNNANAPLPNVMKIFCEGAKTEPGYLQGYIDFRTEEDTERRKIFEIPSTNKNTPVQLVEVALKVKNSDKSKEGDEYWVVYDREAVSKYSVENHAKAYEKAINNGINVALSNVCFEFWLLLHLENTAAPYSCYDNLRDKSNFRKLFKEIAKVDYEKSIKRSFSYLAAGVNDARIRAARLNKAAKDNAQNGMDKPYHLNPYTNVHELLDAIDQFK